MIIIEYLCRVDKVKISLFGIFALLSTTTTFAALNKQTCESMSHAAYHASSCFVIPVQKLNRSDAKTACNHFSNGHLAYVTTESTMKVIQNLTDDPIFTGDWTWDWYRIGLLQVTGSPEPDEGWTWEDRDGKKWMLPDKRLALFKGNEPENGGIGTPMQEIGFYKRDTNGLADGNSFTLTPYVCEYERTMKIFNIAGKNQKGNNGTYLSESTEEIKLDCAIKCSEVPVCRALSYNKGNGHCVLHLTTSIGVPALSPVAATGYEMFDTEY